METEFTPGLALLGGALIGIASAILLVLYGKVAGMSGIAHAVLQPFQKGNGWKISFLAGLLLAGMLVKLWMPELMQGELSLSTPMIVIAGLLVGVGTSLANGCTSGHGVCGMSRFSGRSWVATLTFMVVAMITANLVNLWG